jgi:hypothetical protein
LIEYAISFHPMMTYLRHTHLVKIRILNFKMAVLYQTFEGILLVRYKKTVQLL